MHAGIGFSASISNLSLFEGLNSDFDSTTATPTSGFGIDQIGYDSDANGIANAGQAMTIEANSGSQDWDFSSVTFLNNSTTVKTGNDGDTIVASDSSDATYQGANGADTLIGGAARDTVNAGSGNDFGRVFAEDANDNDNFDGGSGNGDKFQVVLNTDQIGLTSDPTLNPILNEFKAYQQHLIDFGSAVAFTFETFGTTDPNAPDTTDDVTVVNWEIASIAVQVNGVIYDITDCLDQVTNIIVGTNAGETLNGTNGNDLIIGLGGNDTINGGQGADCIFAGSGNDTIQVTGNQAEFDIIAGGGNTDTVVNIGGSNLTFNGFNPFGDIEKLDANGKEVKGNGGENVFDFRGVSMIDVAKVKGEGGDDTIFASTVTHDVTYEGNGGADTLTGQNKRDILHGGDGADEIEGGGDHDTINGGNGIDVINAGSGNDTIQVAGDQAEFDTITGGGNSDTVVNVSDSNLTFDAFNAFGDIENLDANGKEVKGNANGNTFDFTGVALINVSKVKGEGGDDTILASTVTHDVTYEGNGGADTLTGQNKRDILLGGDGNDIINGGGDHDTINGGGDHDTINGGKGNDDLTGGSGNDVFVIHKGDGTDRIFDFDQANNDKIRLTGFGAIDFANDIQPNIVDDDIDGDLDVDDARLTLPGGTVLEFIDQVMADFDASDFEIIP